MKRCTPTWSKRTQERKLKISKSKGNLQFTEDGRNAKITVDLVLQTRAELSENKVNGREDAPVGDQKFFCGEDLHNNEVFSGTISGSDGVSKLVESCETGVSEETRCTSDSRDQKQQSDPTAIGHHGCPSGTHFVSSCAWRRKKDRQVKDNYILVEWMG